MSGFFMIAAVFAINEPHASLMNDVALIFFSVFFLVLSVYAFNALSGRLSDSKNFRLFALKKVSGSIYLLGFIVFLALSVWLAFLIKPVLLLYVAAIKLLWVIYSMPKIGLKNRILQGTILHFFSQILHFNMVYSVFSDPNQQSVLISVFFALIFAAGHLNHEVIDYEADKSVKLKTTAAAFGIRRTSIMSLSVFLFAQIYLVFLYTSNFIGLYVAMPFWISFFIQLFVFGKHYKEFSYNTQKRMAYRNFYRIIYVAACLAILIGKFGF